MNKFMQGLKEETNYTYTENSALTHKSSLNALLDLFGMGAAYRTRSDSDCILLFEKAFKEDEVHALKCLFYLRDVRGGQGERRFFRVVARYLSVNHTAAMRRNLKYVPEFGRWDDLYVFVGTPLEDEAFALMKNQLRKDVVSYMQSSNEGISLLAKWLKSENTSSTESRRFADKTRKAFGMSHKQYRKTLSALRERINVLERLMSAGKWDEIEFDKIPSRAGMIYRNAFARHDIERMKADKSVQTYEEFAMSTDTKVNAKDLYPYEVVARAYKLTKQGYYGWYAMDSMKDVDPVQRAIVNKYWDNLTDYFKGCSLDALCVIDTSGSMWGDNAAAPINVAISLGLYAAEKARGPFARHYISFSSRPQLIEVEGQDLVEKVWCIYKTNLCENTDIEKTFDLLLDTARKNNCSQKDLPKSIVIISDMEFDQSQGYYRNRPDTTTLMEKIKDKWELAGYEMPNLVFWNVEARQNNVPMTVKDGVTLVSGFSPVTFEMLMKGKTGVDLMLDKLDSERYACIK